MQRVNLHARPSIIQVGCPTYFYQVCALDHANRGTVDLDYPSEPFHRDDISIKLYIYIQNEIIYSLTCAQNSIITYIYMVYSLNHSLMFVTKYLIPVFHICLTDIFLKKCIFMILGVCQ